MFRIVVQPTALRQIRRLGAFHAAGVLDALGKYLRDEPERPRGSRIKRLRGKQDATFRLRVGDYRVFYDVEDDKVTVTAVLHKADTARYYRREET